MYVFIQVLSANNSPFLLTYTVSLYSFEKVLGLVIFNDNISKLRFRDYHD